jgi:polysaccharide export outer membrane protein
MTFNTSISLMVLAAVSAAASFGQAGAAARVSAAPVGPIASASQPVLEKRMPRYQLRKSDSFEVDFALSPELNQIIAVQPDGYITLKGASTIAAEGLTIPELTDKIHQAYAGILHDPIITIELKDFDKPYFLAAGQLGKPGKYDLRSDLTVTQAVAVAGGFTEASKHSQVVLFRPLGNGLSEARVLDVKKMLKSHDLAEDIHLKAGDMIFVPQNRMSKISRYLPTSSVGMYTYPVNW